MLFCIFLEACKLANLYISVQECYLVEDSVLSFVDFKKLQYTNFQSSNC